VVENVQAIIFAPLGHAPVKTTIRYNLPGGGPRSFLETIDLVDESYFTNQIVPRIAAHETQKPYYVRNLYVTLACLTPDPGSVELRFVYERSWDRETWAPVEFTTAAEDPDLVYNRHIIFDHIAQDIRRRG
jgi:hypothetical protein